MNTQVLDDPHFEQGLMSILKLYRTNKQFLSNAEGWDHFKTNVKKLAIQTWQRQIEKNGKTFDLLTDEFTELRELIEQDSCDDQDSERFEQVKHELKLKEENKHEGNRIRAKNRKISQ